jgi:hypothetical protein
MQIPLLSDRAAAVLQRGSPCDQPYLASRPTVYNLLAGVRVATATGDDLTNADDPMKVAMRQIAGAFSQLENARLAAKLRTAREAKRTTACKCEGYEEARVAILGNIWCHGCFKARCPG